MNPLAPYMPCPGLESKRHTEYAPERLIDQGRGTDDADSLSAASGNGRARS